MFPSFPVRDRRLRWFIDIMPHRDVVCDQISCVLFVCRYVVVEI